MSDEPEVTPLRLKRPPVGGAVPPASDLPAPARPADPGAAGDPSAVPEAPSASVAGGEAGEGEKVRRRPSLASEAPEVMPEAPPQSREATGGPPAGGFKLRIGNKPPLPPPPPLFLPPDPPVASGAVEPGGGTEGLLIGALPGQAPVPPPMGEQPAASGAPGEGGTLPALPGLAKMGAGAAGTRPPIHLRMEGPADGAEGGAKPPPFPSQASGGAKGARHGASRDALIFFVVFLVIAGLGGGAYFVLSGSGGAAADGGGAEDLVAAAQLPGDEVSEAGEPEPVAAAVEGAGEAVAVPPEVVLLPVKPSGPAGPPVPNPRFVRFADALRVSGVFQGSPARALVDGRLIRSGDVIEPNLGVTFVGVDPEAKQLILEDGSGARVRVKY